MEQRQLKRRICYGVACMLLVAAGIVGLLPADQGVVGLPHEDVIEIQHLVRMELRQSAIFSVSRIAQAPRQTWRAVFNRISPPYQWQDLSGKPRKENFGIGEFPPNTWRITTTQGDLLTLDKTQGHWRIKEWSIKYAK